MKRKDGYLEGCGYVITWALGHLFTLCDIEDYSEDKSSKKWTLNNLPCFPNKFNFKLKTDSDGKVDGGVKKQFETKIEMPWENIRKWKGQWRLV